MRAACVQSIGGRMARNRSHMGKVIPCQTLKGPWLDPDNFSFFTLAGSLMWYTLTQNKRGSDDFPAPSSPLYLTRGPHSSQRTAWVLSCYGVENKLSSLNQERTNMNLLFADIIAQHAGDIFPARQQSHLIQTSSDPARRLTTLPASHNQQGRQRSANR